MTIVVLGDCIVRRVTMASAGYGFEGKDAREHAGMDGSSSLLVLHQYSLRFVAIVGRVGVLLRLGF